MLAGDNDIEGLTDSVVPRRLGPKRASKIRKLFNLSKEDDVRKYVIRRTVKANKDSELLCFIKLELFSSFLLRFLFC